MDAAPFEYDRQLEVAGECFDRVNEMLGGGDRPCDDLLVPAYLLKKFAEQVKHYESKVDELMAENDELRARLEMPNGWTADTAPTYKDLATAFVLANNRNIELQSELYKYHYHSKEQGRKKPTYNEWMGEAVRLKELTDSQAKTIEALSLNLQKVEDENSRLRRYDEKLSQELEEAKMDMDAYELEMQK